STAMSSGVRARTRSDSACSRRRKWPMSADSPAARSAAIAASRRTVRMVPSRGASSACSRWRAPSRTARATSVARAVGSPSRASPKPIRKWASIIPELPRAPITAARAAVVAVAESGASPRARRASATARKVSEKLVPVSPSGTGKTLIRLSSSRPAATQSLAARNPRANRGPSRYPIPTAGAANSALGGDGDRHLGVDLVVESDRPGKEPALLERVLVLDLPLDDREAHRLELGGYVGRGHRAEELAVLARLGGEAELRRPDAGGQRLRLGLVGGGLRGPHAGLGGDPLLVPLGRLEGEA